MIIRANAKVNLGLRILGKREDGYHDISTVMVPVSLNDALEIKRSEHFSIEYSGLKFDTSGELIAQLMHWLAERNWMEPVHVKLTKRIPPGSGLGGASSDLAHFAKYVISRLDSKKNEKVLVQKVCEMSTDSAFFFTNKTAMVGGKGLQVEPIDEAFKGLQFLLVFPGFESHTKAMYRAIQGFSNSIIDPLILGERHRWKRELYNDFEDVLTNSHSEYRDLKKALYEQGALLATLSGSGSAFVGVFDSRREVLLPKGMKGQWCIPI